MTHYNNIKEAYLLCPFNFESFFNHPSNRMLVSLFKPFQKLLCFLFVFWTSAPNDLKVYL